ncbi:MAG: TIGR03987 family protein [Gammaproteobacteria bacterium]|nr:TIGR03987 family protein [Gammaproteobacteria bacterium]
MPIGQLSVIFIVAALLLYTLAVWAERLAGRLRAWHLIVFWLGLLADGTGTWLMVLIARATNQPPGLVSAVHAITGALALLLMLSHCSWATVVLWQRDEVALRNFHRFSTLAWSVWLVPFFIGGAMQGFR